MSEKSQYKSIKEWRIHNPKAYKDAESQDYIDKLCEIFGWSKYIKEKGNGHWNLNRCVESAKGLTKKEWREKFNSAYQAAHRKGWMGKCNKVLIPNTNPTGLVRSEKESHLIALKYTTLRDFRENEAITYTHASYHGWLPKITSHLIRETNETKTYTKEECINSAKKFKYRTQWAKNEVTYYNYARKNGWLDECCQHMIRKSKWEESNIWIKEICLDEAKKCKSEDEWKENSIGSYMTAKKYGIINDCTKHME